MIHNTPVVQRSERVAHNGHVAGSNPAGGTDLLELLALVVADAKYIAALYGGTYTPGPAVRAALEKKQ